MGCLHHEPKSRMSQKVRHHTLLYVYCLLNSSRIWILFHCRARSSHGRTRRCPHWSKIGAVMAARSSLPQIGRWAITKILHICLLFYENGWKAFRFRGRLTPPGALPWTPFWQSKITHLCFTTLWNIDVRKVVCHISCLKSELARHVQTMQQLLLTNHVNESCLRMDFIDID